MNQGNGNLRPTLRRATTRAVTLIEAMLVVMEEGLCNPNKLTGNEWKLLFGEKESMVMNLQKLVHGLAALNVKEVKRSKAKGGYREAGLLTVQDAQILSAWLTEQPALEN